MSSGKVFQHHTPGISYLDISPNSDIKRRKIKIDKAMLQRTEVAKPSIQRLQIMYANVGTIETCFAQRSTPGRHELRCYILHCRPYANLAVVKHDIRANANFKVGVAPAANVKVWDGVHADVPQSVRRNNARSRVVLQASTRLLKVVHVADLRRDCDALAIGRSTLPVETQRVCESYAMAKHSSDVLCTQVSNNMKRCMISSKWSRIDACRL